MKKIILGIGLCAGFMLGACKSHSATNAEDSSAITTPDVSKNSDSTNSKPDTIGKSDGAGTGPAHGHGPDHVDSVIHDSSSVHKVK